MLESFKRFFSDLAVGEKDQSGFEDNDYRVAAAALLIHAATIDGAMSDIEHDRLVGVLRQRFALDQAAAQELVTEATKAEQQAVDLYHFTSLLDRTLDDAGRQQIVEMLWQVAYADGRVTEFEDNLIWRAADLLHVPSEARIALRQRVAAVATNGSGQLRTKTRPKTRAKTRTMTERRPVALITGASAGIGAALARTFARNGHELLLIARREQRLVELADAIAALGHRRPNYLSVDLERHGAVAEIAGAMDRLGVEPETVVNNAGFGLLGPAASLSRSEQLAMVDVNVRALTDLSLAFVDALERRRGGILNVASVAAFLPGPNMAVYYATKAYVVSFSGALHWELRPRGIRVTALCPGPVPTEFQARAGFTDDPNPDMLTRPADRVAEDGYRALRQGRRLVVPGLPNRVTAMIAGFLPRRLLMAAVGRYNAKRFPQV